MKANRNTKKAPNSLRVIKHMAKTGGITIIEIAMNIA
jgi:hypothetical protein